MTHLLYNCRIKITRELMGDDDYGGAVITGTSIVAQNEPARFDYYMPKMHDNQTQGIETEKIYSIFFRSTRQHPISVRENDVVQITFPTVHTEYNKRFRVRGVQRESLHPQDPSSLVECTLIRHEHSRGSGY